MTTNPPIQTAIGHNSPTGHVLIMRLEESIAKKCQSAASAALFDAIRVKNTEEARQLSNSPVPTCLLLPNEAACLRTLQDPADRIFRRITTVAVEADEASVKSCRYMGQFAFSLAATEEMIQAEISSAVRQATELQWKWSTIEDFQRRLERLTPEEFIVLDAVCLGNLNKQIAKRVGVSIRTIEQRRSRVFEKMEVDSAVPLAAQLATVKALVFPLHRRDAPHQKASGPASPASGLASPIINLTSALSHPAYASSRTHPL